MNFSVMCIAKPNYIKRAVIVWVVCLRIFSTHPTRLLLYLSSLYGISQNNIGGTPNCVV